VRLAAFGWAPRPQSVNQSQVRKSGPGAPNLLLISPEMDLGQAIFTEAETWQELRDNVLEVTSLHFEDAAETPKLIQLHFVKDELIAVQAA
jgi:hypothetical protein